jgi:hypothetical protein
MIGNWVLGSRLKFLRAKNLAWNSVFARKNFCLELNWELSRLKFLCIKTVGAIGNFDMKVINENNKLINQAPFPGQYD